MTASNTATENKSKEKKSKNPWLVWGKRLLTLAFFIAVPTLLFMLIKNLEWQEVKDALLAYKPTTLLLGAAIALGSYGVFSSYEVLGKKYIGHDIPVARILPLGFVCYAFNLNLSALVGGIAVRYRLYTRQGLSVATITQLISFNMITNWLGYIILAGIIFSLRLLNLPESWKIGAAGLQVIGIVLLLVAAAYLLACAFSKKRTWKIRKHEIDLPSFKMALTQACVAAVNWSLMGLLVFILLPDNAFYPTVLGILLISGIAGVVTHIPAGLGVLEAIFIAMLQHEISQGEIIAALLGYRALYYLLPLAIACVIYLVLEKKAKDTKETKKADKQSSSQ